MPNLFPEDHGTYVLTEAELSSDTPVGYKNGIAFDDQLGDFMRDGRNKLLDSTGIESWKSWCVNCISTERYKHLAYSSDFGIEVDKAFQAASRAEAESILTREITEALLADPYGRTDYISELEFEWTAPDSIVVHATVHGINDASIDITAYITQGGK